MMQLKHYFSNARGDVTPKGLLMMTWIKIHIKNEGSFDIVRLRIEHR